MDVRIIYHHIIIIIIIIIIVGKTERNSNYNFKLKF